MTTEQKLLLVEQYRIPVHARTIELPAGIIGDEPDCPSESSAAAALRELLEETGYTAGCVEPVMTGASCSGITSERVTLFRALDLHRIGIGGGVAHEDITVHEIPLAEVVMWLEAKAKTGVLVTPRFTRDFSSSLVRRSSVKPPDGEVQRGGKGHHHGKSRC